MSMNKIILFGIIASFLLFEDVENYALRARLDYPNAFNNFTIRQYVGVWYVVALMYPTSFEPHVACEWYEVQEKYDFEPYFVEVYRKMNDDGKMRRYYGHGNVIQARIHVTYPELSAEEAVYIVNGFNEGQELILTSMKDTLFSRLISLKPTASIKARATFEKMASDAKAQVHYINHNICQ